MYLLDTNVVSELRRPEPDRGVVNWINNVPRDRLFLSAVTIGEIQAGIENIRWCDSEKADEIVNWLDEIVAIYMILPMDAVVFQEWARLKHGKPDELFVDAMIAATAKINSLILVTRNTRDFREFGLELINSFGHRINNA